MTSEPQHSNKSPRRSRLAAVLLFSVAFPAIMQAQTTASTTVRMHPGERTAVALLTDTLETSHGDDMVRAYFRDQVRQIQSTWLALVDDLDDWEAQRPRRRHELQRMLGLDPMPERTDLKATVTGRLEHDEFIVEKLHFQSSPGLYVTANLYIPKERSGPLPGVLYVCGHATRTADGVAFGSKTAYQRHAAWYARHGYVALIIDTVQLGEIEGIHHGTYRYDRWWWWNRGYTPAGVETWNGIRALDYLASRPEVDPERLAVTGRSGGGIYSWFITALDDRITTSVPTAGITDLTDYVIDDVVTRHCDCMFMVNSRRWDFPMVAALAAPRPILLANGDVDPLFPLDGVLRVADKTSQVYELYGRPDRFEQLIVDAAHDDTPPLQQATYEWMHRKLHDRELLANDPPETLFDPAELRVFDELPDDEINTRIDELFVPPAPEPDLPATRAAWLRLRDGWMKSLREETFAGWPARDAPLRIEQAGSLASDGLRLTATDFDSQASVRLRMWILSHQDVAHPDTVVLSALDASSWQEWLSILQVAADTRYEAADLVGPGANATSWPAPNRQGLAELAQRLRQERTALAVVAPRGIGPTAWTETARGHGIRRSFMLLGQTHEGMQIWDLRRAMQVVLSDPALQNASLVLEGRGPMAGAAVYASLFQPGASALHLYDLPDSHRDGPILLNVRRIFDMPQAVAAALESVDEIGLYRTAAVEAFPDAWAWPRKLARRGHTFGTLHAASRSPWPVTPAPAQPFVNDPLAESDPWRLVWSDEFEVEGLPDSSKWTYEEGFIRNSEAQYYTRARPENARVEDGALVIESRKEQYKDADYTSASVTTRDRASWRYGRIEVRAKLPTGRGMWPAIWMLGTNISEVGWPESGEIDIMENVGFDPNRIHANVHTAAFNHADGTSKGASILIDEPHANFHVYAVEWYEDHIDFFVDDRKYFTFANTGGGVDEWPFDQPQYLILNTAIGGAWGGRQGIDDSIFPQSFYIDYVRVYERNR